MILLFVLGITESKVLGFTGLSRLLITYIQLCVAILPILILVSTVRSVVGDRESNVLEYYLSMPISLAAYFWGKIVSKFVLIFVPIFLALAGAISWGGIMYLSIPWHVAGYYSLFTGRDFLVLSWDWNADFNSRKKAGMGAWTVDPGMADTSVIYRRYFDWLDDAA